MNAYKRSFKYDVSTFFWAGDGGRELCKNAKQVAFFSRITSANNGGGAGVH